MSVGPIHHLAIVVRSIDEALPRYRELFGIEPEAPPMTFAPQRVRLCFLPTGPEPAARLELVEPLDNESGVARYLASHGEGVHHVCLLTDDLPASLDALAAADSFGQNLVFARCEYRYNTSVFSPHGVVTLDLTA